jgi:DNA-nicking Smr family endonuclease
MASKDPGEEKPHSRASNNASEADRVVRIPITDTLDLHAFSPADVAPLLEDYLEACVERGLREIRIIHGRGKGVQRRRVQSLLSRSSLVQSFRDADPGGGGWGATVAVLATRGAARG